MKIWSTEHVFRLVTLDPIDIKESPFHLLNATISMYGSLYLYISTL